MTANALQIAAPATSRRYLALVFPFLSVERWHRDQGTVRPQTSSSAQADPPLVIVEKVQNAFRLGALDARSQKLGLGRGMSLADARARIPELLAIDADPQADSALLMRLASYCDRYTPLVAMAASDVLMLDITGCSHLFGTERQFLARVTQDLFRLGLSVHAVIAATPDAARALARAGRSGIVPVGQDDICVRRLPVATLELEEAIVHALARAGLKTIGDLADRPSRVLAARFGEDLIAKLRRALGHEDIRITPIRPLPDCMVERRFPEPLMHSEALEGVLVQLLQDAAALLERNGLGGRHFEASFFATDGQIKRLGVETGKPSRDAKAVLRLFRERMASLAEPVDPGFGFDVIRLSVAASEPVQDAQTDFAGETGSTAALDDLLDRLATRLGRERVLHMVLRDTHHPVRAGGYVPVMNGQTAAALAPSPSQTPEPAQPPARPLQLFDPPQPIEAVAEVPDGPPLRFRWRRRLYSIVRAEGPERIAPEWWRANPDDKLRDYYRIEDDEGRRYWVFRQGLFGGEDSDGRWFLHGLFA